MATLFLEVMKMQNRDKTFLQKLKDNAFYVALGLGLLAILAVVAVYTMERSGSQVAENEVDLNQASDYSAISTEEIIVEETNGKTANQAGRPRRKRNRIRRRLQRKIRKKKNPQKQRQKQQQNQKQSRYRSQLMWES